MIYPEYDQIKRKYHASQKAVERILTEKEKLFQMTQPKSTMGEYEREFDKSISFGAKGGDQVNQIEQYVIRLEDSGVNERLREAKGILEEWRSLLDDKEQELRQSKNIDDQLYLMRFIDHMRVRDIARKLHYSQPQIYRRINMIKSNLQDERK